MVRISGVRMPFLFMTDARSYSSRIFGGSWTQPLSLETRVSAIGLRRAGRKDFFWKGEGTDSECCQGTH